MKFSTGEKGYTLIILLIAIAVMSVGLLIAIPVWKTQIQREKEAELIFRGHQYVEAVRLYQLKYPGRFPHSLKELLGEKCIRRLYKEPMTKDGLWDVILLYQGVSRQRGQSPQKVMIAPQRVLSSLDNPQILGVVSSSPQKSIKIYNGQMSYDKWLFFYGQDPQRMPEIIRYGQAEQK